jgi:hypothetical protein
MADRHHTARAAARTAAYLTLSVAMAIAGQLTAAILWGHT